MHSSLPRVALQNKLTAGLCHCKWTISYLLIIQVCSDPIHVRCSTGQDKIHSSLSCVALQKQADSIVMSLQRHLWIFLQHTGVQYPITNALQHCSWQNAFLTACVALQNRLTAVLCHCKHTFGYFFKTQVCSVPSPMHYSTSQGKSHSSLPRVTLQNRLTAGLCHCK